MKAVGSRLKAVVRDANLLLDLYFSIGGLVLIKVKRKLILKMSLLVCLNYSNFLTYQFESQLPFFYFPPGATGH